MMDQPNKYKGKQVIILSDRIIFSSDKDNILLTSNNSIGFSAKNSVNFDTEGHIIMNSPKIYLGLNSYKEKEPILLGTSTINLLRSLIGEIKTFCDSLEKTISTPTGTKIVHITVASVRLKEICNKLLKDLPNIKSKNNFTE